MRVALVYRHFNLAGSLPRAHVELARFIARQGHDTHVFSIKCTRDRDLHVNCTFHDIDVDVRPARGLSARELVLFATHVRAALHHDSFDVTHARLPSVWKADIVHLAGVARGEARRAGVADWRWVAGTMRRPGLGVRWGMEALAIRTPRRIHVDSSQVRDDLVNTWGIDSARITIAHTGVNLEEFSPVTNTARARRELGLPERRTVLFVGHDWERKGLDRATAAIAELDAQLVVVGGRNRPPQGNVVFAGPRGDAYRFYQAAEVVVLPTRVDMWGSSVVEAMASGVPPVVTSVAGSADIVEHGKDGVVLSHPFDQSELRDWLRRLLTSDHLRKTMGTAGRAKAAQLSWQRYGEIVERDLLEIADRRNGQLPRRLSHRPS